MKPQQFQPHRYRARISDGIAALGTVGTHPLTATVYRFINPRFSNSSEIASGKESRTMSGRWHCKGEICISYTSLEPETALAETLAHVRYYNLPEKHGLFIWPGG